MKELVFEMDGPPPRHTLQASRGVQRTAKGVRFFTKKLAADEMRAMREAFKARLPAGWAPLHGPCRITVQLVYPLRKKDRPRGDELLPHFTRPDGMEIFKGLADCLNGVAYVDDGQLYSVRVSKFRSRRPHWSVRVTFDSPPSPAQGVLFAVQ